MEDRRPDQDDSESWHPNTETARPSFLASWLRRRQESFLGAQERDTSLEEDDDDEESESTLPKRFRRFFRRVFNQIVEPVEQASERSPQYIGLPFNIESVPNASAPTSVEASVDVQPYSPITEQTIDRDELPVVNATTNQLEQAAQPPSEASERPLYIRPNSLLPEAAQPYVENQQPSREVRQEANQTVVERQEIQRNGGATLALLGAEFFARRRADRKVEQKFTTQVKALEQRIDTGNDSQIRLEKRVTTQVKQQTATPEQVQSFWAIQPERPQSVPERIANTPDRPVTQSYEQPQPRTENDVSPQNVDRQIRTVEERPIIQGREVSPRDKSEVFTPTIEVPEKQIKPRAVLEKVVEAAEHNAPLERAYERRQEIKDDTSGPSTPGGASAVGEILARSAPATPPPVLSYGEHGARQAAQTPHQSDPQLYQAAMANGARAAVVIIVFAVLAYLLVG